MLFGKLRALITSLANQIDWQAKTNNAAHSAIMSQMADIAAKQQEILTKQDAFDQRLSFASRPRGTK